MRTTEELLDDKVEEIRKQYGHMQQMEKNRQLFTAEDYYRLDLAICILHHAWLHVHGVPRKWQSRGEEFFAQ